MFGIPILGYVGVFCDNQAVYKNTAFAESTLKKKHKYILFHSVRECVASGIMIVHKVYAKYNLAGILTKSLSAEDWFRLSSMIMIDDVYS